MRQGTGVRKEQDGTTTVNQEEVEEEEGEVGRVRRRMGRRRSKRRRERILENLQNQNLC